jgi:hypothetical protein
MIEHALALMLDFFGLLRRKAFMEMIRAGRADQPTLSPPDFAATGSKP